MKNDEDTQEVTLTIDRDLYNRAPITRQSND